MPDFHQKIHEARNRDATKPKSIARGRARQIGPAIPRKYKECRFSSTVTSTSFFCGIFYSDLNCRFTPTMQLVPSQKVAVVVLCLTTSYLAMNSDGGHAPHSFKARSSLVAGESPKNSSASPTR
jgi:hypothetical protein